MDSPGYLNSPSKEIDKITDHGVSLNLPSVAIQDFEPVHINCQNCGHAARNHFAEHSPIKKRCLEKGCECGWAWDGKTGTRELVSITAKVQ